MPAHDDGKLFEVAPIILNLPEIMSADQKRTSRNNAMLLQNKHPATKTTLLNSDAGETCGSCRHAEAHGWSNRHYWKCGLVAVTNGAGTDIRLKWPACRLWAARDDA